MSRRMVPGTFWVGILTALLLLLSDTMRAAGPANPYRVPVLVGLWDGFFLGADGAVGHVRSAITDQDFRALAGGGMLLDLEDRVAYNAINFRATLTGADFVVGSGVARTGHVTFQAGLETFAGAGGGAGILTPVYHFVPPGGAGSRIDAILLRPFPGDNAPNISNLASRDGTFQSLVNPKLRGPMVMTVAEGARGSFPVEVTFQPAGDPSAAFTWPYFATTSADGSLVMIGRGAAGQAITQGVLILPPVRASVVGRAAAGTTVTTAFVNSYYRLLRNDGSSDFGFYNCTLIRQ